MHIRNFLEISDAYIPNGISSNYVRLTPFPHSLVGKSRQWLDTEPQNSITTREYLAKKFLSRFFPSGKPARLRSEILSFKLKNGEDMYQAWARFK